MFQSERLGFRNWLAKDTDLLVALNADPVNMEFFERPKTTEESVKSIGVFQQRIENGELAMYAVDRLDTGAFVGMIGFGRIGFESIISPCIEIGWRLDKAHWGHGFATEGARACLLNFWSKYPEQAVRAITAFPNRRSVRVMEKLGMRAIGFFYHPKVSDGHPLQRHVCYEIAPKGV